MAELDGTIYWLKLQEDLRDIVQRAQAYVTAKEIGGYIPLGDAQIMRERLDDVATLIMQELYISTSHEERLRQEVDR